MGGLFNFVTVQNGEKRPGVMRTDVSKVALNMKGFDRLPISERWYLGADTHSPCCAPLLFLHGLSAPLPAPLLPPTHRHQYAHMQRQPIGGNQSPHCLPLKALLPGEQWGTRPTFLEHFKLVLTFFFLFEIIITSPTFSPNFQAWVTHVTKWRWHLFRI